MVASTTPGMRRSVSRSVLPSDGVVVSAAPPQRYAHTPQIYAAGGAWPEVHQEIERLLPDAGGAFGATPVPVYLDHPVLDGLAAVARATLNTSF